MVGEMEGECVVKYIKIKHKEHVFGRKVLCKVVLHDARWRSGEGTGVGVRGEVHKTEGYGCWLAHRPVDSGTV